MRLFFFLILLIGLTLHSYGQILTPPTDKFYLNTGSSSEIKHARAELFWDKQPESYLALGKAYLTGSGVKKNEHKARKNLKKAAKKLREAKLLLAMSYTQDPKLSSKKRARYFQQIRQLAQEDYPLAQYALFLSYTTGTGTTADAAQAITWLTRAATAPTPVEQAQTFLGTYYYQGYPPYLTADKEKAFALFTAAAEEEEPYACYNLARMYQLGEGTQKNDLRAFHFMRESARHKLVEAQMALSDFYRQGIGTQPDEYGTFSWMLQAAKQDNAAAQEQTALNYWQGIGTAKNTQEALEWAKKAQKNNGSKATEILHQIQESIK